MATEVWIALIAMIGVAITQAFNTIVALKTKTEVKEMHTSVNSKMDELLKAAKQVAKIEGRDEERASVAQAKKLADEDTK